MGRILNKIVRFFITRKFKSGLEQELNEDKSGGQLVSDAIIPLARRAAAEGIVLLKNNGVLPIREKDKVSVFGRTAINYFAVGYGSGGDVRHPYIVNIIDGLANNGVSVNKELLDVYAKWVSKPKNIPDEGFWGNWPMNFPEMPLNRKIVRQAAAASDMALVIIGRAAGEDRENKLIKGSYYLTDTERRMLDMVTSEFTRTAVVLDCGNIIDMSWTKIYGDKIGAIVYAWQGGMESGNAVCDALTGRVNPCGKLADTIAVSYDAFPTAANFGNNDFNNYVEDIYAGYRYFETFSYDKVLYPFGFGLSYTNFEIKASGEARGNIIDIKVAVKNTGKLPGKEVVQVYVSAPQGVLGKPERALAAFAKTKELQPAEIQELALSFDLADFASYDDSGITGHKSAWLLEKGRYTVYAGCDVRTAGAVFTCELNETAVIRQVSEVMAVKPNAVFKRLARRDGLAVYEDVPTVTTNLKEIILNNLPKEIPFTGDAGLKLSDVKSGKCSMEQFVAQLTPAELDDLCHGEGRMNSKLGTGGNSGALGGISEPLRAKGIPPVITVDGPAGVRLKRTCTLLPCGTALACTFDTELVAEVYTAVAAEMKRYSVDILLAPGMNIHRDPLCGRNFEYFSEDPLLSGKMGAAVVNGLQRAGVSASPKHFACNNQEKNRSNNDSRVSERALREIYLKGFEIMVKESNPHTVMTSYNKINGVWSHYNYELATVVLREEWGYNGLVITDWWMRAGVSPEFPLLKNDAYRVRAQVDVLMPGGAGPHPSTEVGRNLLDTYGQPDGITLGELQRTAANVLNYVLISSANIHSA